jgi:5-(carboxyamino)imidazole ribonucleotide synthase
LYSAPMMQVMDQSPPTVGILGAGQLARMTYQASIPLGIRLSVLAEHARDPAALIAASVACGSPHSLESVTAFAAGCDVLTFDHELVDTSILHTLEEAGQRVCPTAATVAIAQDKRQQRALFSQYGFPVPAYRPVHDVGHLLDFANDFGWPIVVKARRGGYDGRGVWILDGSAAASGLIARTASAGIELLVEEWVPIECEIAVLVARRISGEAVVYPVVETVQRNGICHELLAPARVEAAVAAEARRLALEVANAVGVIGVMALELFVSDGRLLVNEIAARPHNSGHYSIEGCVTSQFEQHLRAVLDWPLGAVDLVAPAVATVNVLGGSDGFDPAHRLRHALALPGIHVHLYGKSPRPGRKLGHVTALDQTVGRARERAATAAARLGGTALVEVPT